MTGTLFDLDEPAPVTDAPCCRMCARPAWRNGRGEITTYCTSKGCGNRERLCQACHRPFTVGVDGAGTKYCSIPCKDDGYHPTRGSSRDRCAWCDKPSTDRHRSGAWPYICQACLDPLKHVIDRLRAHHVSHERARQLLAKPDCELCGRNLLLPVTQRSHGRPRALLVVDHDHACCPSYRHSCGRCVRGLICHGCNSALGLIGDNPKTARALANYLDRFFL